MKCLECKGACCEMLVVPFFPNAVALEYWGARGQLLREEDETSVALDTRCPKLTRVGRCSIYENRPKICADFKVGGSGCLEAVKMRRTPEEYQRIRDPEDPEVLNAED